MQYVPSITMPALTLMGIMHFRTYLSLRSVHGMYTVLTVGMKFMDRRGIVLWKLVGIYSHILALVATLYIVTIAR